ncbi:HTTM domain-containing protein [Leucobacter chinensis]|uniref:HTTM domain-containing protein n=1 Tax=Leucobacter chinensis TaxID=2851010 RepID=UPI001C21EA98|nr:HTTM domain-containing protein [Leucobacter chinensis]
MVNNSLFDRAVAWFTDRQHNLRSFSMLRILYGVGLLAMLLSSSAERALLWGHASLWVDPEAKRRGFHTFDFIFTKSSPVLFDIAFFGLILVVALFIVGWRTRIMTFVLLVMLVSLQANNPYVLNGGDTLMRITLFFMLFANLGEFYSLDARRRAKQRRAGKVTRAWLPAHVSNAAHNAALILGCFQIIVVYVTSGVWKLLGDEWLDGTALFYALRLDVFMAYPMVNEFIWQSSLVIYVATFIALWVQTLFPLMLLWRPTRIFALASLIFMHLGIAVLLGLWPFSLAMIALDMLFVRDASWVSALAWVQRSKAFNAARDARNRAMLAMKRSASARKAGRHKPVL